MWFLGIDRSGLSQKKVAGVVALMAEQKGDTLLYVISLVVWFTLTYNKLFSNLMSVRIAR